MKILQYKPGMTIDKPCFVASMPNDVYHAWPNSISKTGLDLVDRSPAHYYFAPAKERTRFMTIGSAIHCAILEPERFSAEYMLLRDAKDRRATEYKQAIKNLDEELVLVSSEADNVIGMQESVYANERSSKLLRAPGHRELSAFAQDPETGVWVRCRYDLILDDGTIVDVKKTQDARYDAFSRSLLAYRYHVQAAVYSDVYEWITGDQPESFNFLAIEERAPNSSKVYRIDDTATEQGRKEYRPNLNLYAQCIAENHWPSYPDSDDELIGLPDWRVRQIENELDDAGITTEE